MSKLLMFENGNAIRPENKTKYGRRCMCARVPVTAHEPIYVCVLFICWLSACHTVSFAGAHYVRNTYAVSVFVVVNKFR